MLIDMYGNIEHDITGVATMKHNVILGENQFFQWTPTGKRLELWVGKKQYLENDDYSTESRRIKFWCEKSILAFIY